MLTIGLVAALSAHGCSLDSDSAAVGNNDDGGGVGASRAELTSAGQGFVWVVGATGAKLRWRNATGGEPTVNRNSAGYYSIAFGFNPKHVQIAMSGTTTGLCKIWTTTSTTINVVCYDAAGTTLTDKDFVVQAANYSGTNSVATAFYATVSNTAAISDSWSASGQGVSGSLNSTTKVRTISAAGISGSNSSVHVTTFAGDSSRCRILSWSTANVNVECRTAAGALSTPYFTLWYGDAGPFSEYNNWGGPLAGGHAWHNAAGGEHSSYNRKSVAPCDDGTPYGTVTGSASGNDRLYAIPSDLWQSSIDEVTALVTPYGSSQIDCRVRRVSSDYVVSCADYSGTTVNANSYYFTFSMGTVDYPTCI